MIVPRAIVIAMAFIGGWVDVASFVGLDFLMAAHITGNIVLLAYDLENGFSETDLIKVIAIPSFFVAVIVFTLLHDRRIIKAPNQHARLPVILFIEAALLCLAGILAVLVTDWRNPTSFGFGLALAIALPAVVAMACQNAAHRLYPTLGPATTVMTGNIAQFFIDETRRLIPSRSVPEGEKLPRGERSLPILILAFVLGCVTSAFLTGAIGPASLLAPAALLLFLGFAHRSTLKLDQNVRSDTADG